jgi:hypothetical protein
MPVASRCGLRPSSSGTFSWARAASSMTRHSRPSVLRSSRSLRRNRHGRCADLEARLLSGQRWIYVDQQSLLKSDAQRHAHVAALIHLDEAAWRYAWGLTADVLTLEGLRQRRPEILRVARKRKVHRIAVFGSVARGERLVS